VRTGFASFRNCLNQHWRRRRSSTQNFLESKQSSGDSIGTSGLLPRLAHGNGRGKFGNITKTILLIRLHLFTTFMTQAFSQLQTAIERFMIDFHFFLAHFQFWRLGFGGASGEPGSSIPRITIVSACMDFGNTTWGHCNSDFLDMLSLFKNASRSLWWETWSSNFIPHQLGVSHADARQSTAFFIHVITLGSGSIKDPQKIYGCRVIFDSSLQWQPDHGGTVHES